jgi:lipopolysaccharide export system permease protein
VGATLIAGTSFLLNGWVIPNSNKSRLEFELLYLKKNTNFSRHNIHMQVARNTFMYLQSYNNVSNSGYHFSLEKFEGNKLVEKLTAKRIEWDTTLNKWHLKDWQIKQINRVFEPNATDTVPMIRKGQAMDTTLSIHPKEFENDYRKYDGLTLNELDAYIKTLRSRGSAGIEAYEVEKYTRYASPFSIFILTFMGVIVSARKSRGGTGFQIALGFLLSFIFILFFMMFRTFAEAGALPPQISVWIPAIIFGVLSLVMYKYVPR